MTKRLDIPPRLGDAICQVIEKTNNQQVHVVLIACPVERSGKLGQPTFVTSLQPDEMENLVTQIAGGFALGGKRHVTDN